MSKKSDVAKVGSSFTSMFKRLFVREKLSALEEEAIQTPLKTILKNFFRNRLGVIGLIAFIVFLIFCFGGSQLRPLQATYTELTNSNLRPGTNYLNYPKTLDVANVKKIVSGTSFSAAVTNDGNLVMWGTEPNFRRDNVADYVLTVPDEVKQAKIVDIAAGGQHMLALDDTGELHGWGYYGHGQTTIPDNILKEIEEDDLKIEEIYAATMWSAIVTSDKNIHLWGSMQTTQNFKVARAVKGHIEKVAAGDNNIALLLDDGTIAIIGEKSSEFYNNMPDVLGDGTVQVVDIAATNRNVLALTSEGDIYTWGSSQDRLTRVPEFTGDVKQIDSGYRHFNMLLEDGSVVAWGSDQLNQSSVPEDLPALKTLFSDYFQVYGIDEQNNLHAWGNKGYILGSDEYGRDILTRLIHGGRISLTVGAIATAISVTIAIIVGLTAGYFGGWVDHLLMRVTDIFNAIPFYPIAVTLSYAIGNSMNESQKLYLIMVILGVLNWMGLARLIRAQLLVEREKDFVLAAKALGIRQGKIMWRHILPNVFSLVIINITLSYAGNLLSEAGLSFLGFGVSQPTPSWGNMLTSAQQSTVIQMYWWRWFIPGLFVVLAALSANLIGDALREAIDPRENER